MYQAQKHQNFDGLKGIFKNCQERLNEKLEFLQQTLDYIQKYEVDMISSQSM